MCEAILLILGVFALLGAWSACVRPVGTSKRNGMTRRFRTASRRVPGGEGVVVCWNTALPRSFPCRINSAWQQDHFGEALSKKGGDDVIVFPGPSLTAYLPTAQRFGMFCKPVSSGFGGFSLLCIPRVADGSELYVSISPSRALLAG